MVMPISGIDGCNEQHWLDVKGILTESLSDIGFKANLVSYADDAGIIQKRIIHNLYENPVVVCDVSGKNPNVMFELGMRLAFDKPTIIIKDDKTDYSFDTSPIEHLEYPRDLRFTKVVDFKEALKEKVEATYEKSQKDPSYTAFLKHFGTFTVAKLDTKEVSKEDFIIEELRELRRLVRRQEIHRFGSGVGVPGVSYYSDITVDPSLVKSLEADIYDIISKDLGVLSMKDVESETAMSLIKDMVVSREKKYQRIGGRKIFDVAFSEAYNKVVLGRRSLKD